ncbi:hypothetical protein [Mocis latipes granulovirus]|uniref:Uncharacterized protein n=1 Tax=Mocis latipes granulovirus TaxID=2072024 RepID=A0A161CD25_9BBAC|nr:hypothetical protein [Mocis latipes granulovirus]AKR17401.1 hypothetical protein [Mocis latipes granulovirus]
MNAILPKPMVNLNYEEQKKWTKICEMYTYLSRIEDIDDDHMRMVKVMCDGFVALMVEENKNKVLYSLLDLLQQHIDRDKYYNVENEEC